MKKIMMMALVAGLVGAAQADYYINFSSYWGNTIDGGDFLPNIGDQATVQLIYAGANGIADYGNGDVIDASVDTDLLAGDDVLLYSGIFENTGGLYEESAAGSFGVFDGAAFLGAPVYGRIFNSSAPGDGDRFYVGSVANLNDLDSGAEPPPVPDNYDLVGPGVGLSPNATGTVIPEPATIGLMGIAGLGLYLSRRKARC